MTDTFFNRPLCGFEAPPERVSQSSGGATARWKHLFPFRTEQLSTAAPMVLGGQPPGRVGRRRFFLSNSPVKPEGLDLGCQRRAVVTRPSRHRALACAGHRSPGSAEPFRELMPLASDASSWVFRAGPARNSSGGVTEHRAELPTSWGHGTGRGGPDERQPDRGGGTHTHRGSRTRWRGRALSLLGFGFV